MTTLFQEAVDALQTVEVLDDEQTLQVMEFFTASFPFTSTGAGKINWKEIKNKLSLSDKQQIVNSSIYSSAEPCFIIWNDASVPILQSTLGSVIKVFDDVIAVSFDTWIFIPRSNNVIEKIFGQLTMTTNIS